MIRAVVPLSRKNHSGDSDGSTGSLHARSRQFFRGTWQDRGTGGGRGMSARTAPLAIDEVNRLDRAGFVAALGPACENSPWVIERSWDARPFRDVAALHAAIRRTIVAAPRDEKVAFLRAHPDLAGTAAR